MVRGARGRLANEEKWWEAGGRLAGAAAVAESECEGE